MPSNPGASTGVIPTPTLAPAMAGRLPAVPSYGGPPTSAAAMGAPMSRYTPGPPAPSMGPGVTSSSPFGPSSAPAPQPLGSLPGYGGSRMEINYGAASSPLPEGPGSFDPAGAPYGPSYASPSYGSPDQGYPPYGGPPNAISSCAPPFRWYEDISAFYNYSAFKGPLDLDGLNGNFGSRVGVFGSVPVYAPLGIAAQLGSSYGWYDWKGTLYTGDGDRTQNFNTAGLFQRTAFGLNYGATYDWLLDDYYADFHFEQVRAAVSYNLNPCNEIGVWAAMPTRKDSATLGVPPVNNTFEPVLQGNLFWRKVWNNHATTNTFIGWCEEPSDFSFGSSVQFPLNDCVAVNGGLQYIWPGSGSNTGREEEIWTISLGLVFYPGTATSAATSSLRPLLAMPDNGNFAIRRH